MYCSAGAGQVAHLLRVPRGTSLASAVAVETWTRTWQLLTVTLAHSLTNSLTHSGNATQRNHSTVHHFISHCLISCTPETPQCDEKVPTVRQDSICE